MLAHFHPNQGANRHVPDQIIKKSVEHYALSKYSLSGWCGMHDNIE